MSSHTMGSYEDREAIKELKARYCRFVDTKQWDRLATLFTARTRFDGFGSAPMGSDAKAFIAGISARLAKVISIHHCHMPEIMMTGSDTARGIWSMMDYLEFAEGAAPKEAPESRGFVAYGYYEEEYERTEAGWKFSYMRLTRMRIDALSPSHPKPRAGLLSPMPDWL